MNQYAHPKNVVLFTSGRRGTWLLLTALAGHPQVRIHAQVFGCSDYYPHDTPAQLLERLFDRWPPGVRAVILPLGWDEGRDGAPDLWECLRQREASVIYLRRRNMLRWYVSKRLARMTATWMLREPPLARRPTVRIDPRRCLQAIRHDLVGEAAGRSLLAGLRSIDVVYEELVRDFDREVERIQRFLDVEPRPLKPQTFKQERRPLPEVIKNYDQLRRAWAGTPWESYLEEGAEAEPAVTPN